MKKEIGLTASLFLAAATWMAYAAHHQGTCVTKTDPDTGSIVCTNENAACTWTDINGKVWNGTCTSIAGYSGKGGCDCA